MAIAPQVFGACLFEVNMGSGYASLGYTVDGADWEETLIEVPIKSDVFLEATRDVQWSGTEGIIRASFIEYDPTVLAAVQARFTPNTEGVQLAAGTLLMAGGYSYAMKLYSTSTSGGSDATCFQFNAVYTAGALTRKIGTHASIVNVTFKYLIPHGASTMAGATAWQTC